LQLPKRKVKGLHKNSKMPGISQIAITAKKQEANFTAMTDGTSLYLLNRPSEPYTISVNKVCIGHM
jgi:hypothetical protein